MKYFGIADAHGIESFVLGDPESPEHKQSLFIMGIRANANRHRHAVVYVVDITEETASEIEEAIKEGKYEKALKIMKRNHLSLSLAKVQGDYKGSWDMIPNKALDPYN